MESNNRNQGLCRFLNIKILDTLYVNVKYDMITPFGNPYNMKNAKDELHV